MSMRRRSILKQPSKNISFLKERRVSLPGSFNPSLRVSIVTPGRRKVWLKKQVKPSSVHTRFSSPAKTHKTLARKLLMVPHNPQPGTLAYDLSQNHESFLEVNDDIILTSKNLPNQQELAMKLSETGPRFVDEKVIQRSIVGPVESYSRMQQKEIAALEEKTGDAEQASKRKRILFPNAQDEYSHPSGQRYIEDKLRTVCSNRAAEKDKENLSLSQQPLSAKLQKTKEQRVLQQHEAVDRQWDKVSRSLSKKLGQDPSALCVNRQQEWRQRKEWEDILERTTPLEQKLGTRMWQTDLKVELPFSTRLRKKQTFERVALYKKENHEKLRSVAPDYAREIAFVRKPMSAGTPGKKRWMSEYHTARAEELIKVKKEPEDGGLFLQGTDKFKLELQAAKVLGVDKINPDLVDNFSPSQKEFILRDRQGQVSLRRSWVDPKKQLLILKNFPLHSETYMTHYDAQF